MESKNYLYKPKHLEKLLKNLKKREKKDKQIGVSFLKKIKKLFD